MKKILKNFLVICGIVSLVSVFFSTTLSQDVSAADGFNGGCRNFLGLTSWDCGVNIKDENSLKDSIWIIVSNIITDITVVAAYLVLGYVIYGGYLYILSAGDPGKIASGKKTLAHAFIGLGIVVLASVIMGSIRFALIQNNTIGDCVSSECVTPNQMIENLISWAIGIAGAVALIFVVYGGIAYITSSGDPGKVKKAKDIILYALIGLVVVALAEAITAFVFSRINDANPYSSINTTTISKEVHEINIS